MRALAGMRTTRQALRSFCSSPMRALGWGIAVRTSPRRRIHGVLVIDLTRGHATEQMLARIGEALELVRRYSPQQHARLLRDRMSVAIGYHGGPRYLPFANACLVDLTFIQRTPPIPMAGMVLHEATHARLHRAGFRYEGRRREHIERVCVNAELAFLRHFPGQEERTAKLEHMISPESNERWWTDAAQFERRYTELQQAGVAPWLLRMYALLFRPR